MTEVITLKVEPMAIIVMDGAEGRLTYRAEGLEIYVSGRVTTARRHQVSYQAQLECRARHIPVRSLRRVCFCEKSRKPKVDPKQGRLF